MTALAALFARDARIAVRIGGGAMMGVLFFLAVVIMVPFALGPDLTLLRRIGPAILWLGALLSSLLALDRLFANDQEDGSLDLILMARPPLELAIATKAFAQWVTTGLPLVIASPILGLFLNLEPKALAATRADAPRRHPRPDLHRRDRRSARECAASRWPAAAGPGAAADNSGLDLRGGGVDRGDRRPDAVRNPVHDSVRAHADECGYRTFRRRRHAAARAGMNRMARWLGAGAALPHYRPRTKTKAMRVTPCR